MNQGCILLTVSPPPPPAIISNLWSKVGSVNYACAVNFTYYATVFRDISGRLRREGSETVAPHFEFLIENGTNAEMCCPFEDI